jgi:hypothetical protein
MYAISATGTLVDREPAGSPGAWTTIAELQSITPPGYSRNTIDTSAHNDPEDSFIVGMLRKGEMSLRVGYIPGDPTHDDTDGLIAAIRTGQRDRYRIRFPEGSVWLFSGYVTAFNPGAAELDAPLTADVTIRPTGTMTII